jgi:hypothetical protein
MTLYNITQHQREIISYLEESGGEATEELLKFLEVTREAFEIKAEAYGYLILDAEANVTQIDAEIKRLQALKKTKTNMVDRLKEALKNALMLFGKEDSKGIKRFETPLLKLSTRRSESVEITDEKSLPSSCFVVKHEVSKTLIKTLIETGSVIEGAEIRTNYSVVIR